MAGDDITGASATCMAAVLVVKPRTLKSNIAQGGIKVSFVERKFTGPDAPWRKRPMWQNVVLAILGGGIAFALLRDSQSGGNSSSRQVAPATDPGAVSRSALGDAWPFTVSSGTIDCQGGAVTFTAAGVTYAVNGTARQSGRFQEIDAIWASDPNPSNPGAKIDISPIIDRGLKLCQ